MAGARRGRPVAADLVAVGEIGLGGEMRQAAQTPRRLAEAARLGFRYAIVPTSVADTADLELVRVGDGARGAATPPGSTRKPARTGHAAPVRRPGASLALLS